MSADFAWLVDNSRELCERYAGKWIAVQDGKVVAVGDTATEAAEHARAAVGSKPFILEAITEDADVIYGGVSMVAATH